MQRVGTRGIAADGIGACAFTEVAKYWVVVVDTPKNNANRVPLLGDLGIAGYPDDGVANPTVDVDRDNLARERVFRREVWRIKKPVCGPSEQDAQQRKRRRDAILDHDLSPEARAIVALGRIYTYRVAVFLYEARPLVPQQRETCRFRYCEVPGQFYVRNLLHAPVAY